MSDQEDQELIASLQRAYEALSRGDFDAAIEIADPDIELVTIGSGVIFRGADQVRAWMEPETMEEVAFDPEHFEVAGNSVLVRQVIRGRGVASGITIEMGFLGRLDDQRGRALRPGYKASVVTRKPKLAKLQGSRSRRCRRRTWRSFAAATEFWDKRDESLIVELLYPNVIYDLWGTSLTRVSMSDTTASGA